MKLLTGIVILAIIGLIVFVVIYPTSRYNAGYLHAVNVIGRQTVVFEYRDTITMKGKATVIKDTTFLPDTTQFTQIEDCQTAYNECINDKQDLLLPSNTVLPDSFGGTHDITFHPRDRMFFENYTRIYRDSVRTIYIPPSKLPYYISGIAVLITILTIIFK